MPLLLVACLPSVVMSLMMTTARTTTHFLPKFENADRDTMLSEREGKDLVLCMSKKQSGSLVMCPPFYAKNSVGNRFSRLPAMLLLDHFRCCFENQGDAKFREWWDEAEAAGLSYCFEAVTPRILGDHGATPKAAFLSLTSVARDEKFLSPITVLELATRWRLPLNEAWIVPWTDAPRVEAQLRDARWTATNSDADRLLCGHTSYKFLPHEETQGSILEGFVLFALQVRDIPKLQGLADNYKATMEPHRGKALAAALRWGNECNRLADLASFAKDDDEKGFRGGGGGGGDKIFFGDFGRRADEQVKALLARKEPGLLKREPVRDGGVKDPWILVRDLNGPLGSLFRCLETHYKHLVDLKPYRYRGRRQIQISVRSDDVFFAWPLHMKLTGAAPLFRGMVVTLDDAAESQLASIPETANDDAVVAITKLKFLKYLVRTFGVRNALKQTIKTGVAGSQNHAKHFCDNWSVPSEHRAIVASLFHDWAQFIEENNNNLPIGRDNTGYLAVLEPFLQRRDARTGENWSGGPSSLSPTVDGKDLFKDRAVLVVDLTPGGKKDIETFVPGLWRRTKALPPPPGSYRVLRNPPKRDELLAPNSVCLAFGPSSGDDDDDETKWSHMWHRLRTQVGDAATVCIDPPDAAAWREFVAALPPPVAVTPRRRTVVAIYGLPPGGGKSSFFDKLTAATKDCVIVSSDHARIGKKAQSRDHVNTFEAELRRVIDEDDADDDRVVAYDKNCPDQDGLRRLSRACSSTKADVRLILVAPKTLDVNECWSRVAARPPDHIGLTSAVNNARDLFDNAFAAKCAETIEDLDARGPLTGVIRTDAFFAEDLSHLEDLAKDVASLKHETLPRVDDLVAELGGRDRRDGGPPWLALDIEGTSLHVTLVPPGEDTTLRSEALKRAHLLDKKVEVQVSQYVVASSKNLRVGFWVVDSMTGLDDHYAPQAAIYHITDLPALSGPSKPKHAADAMRQLRGLPGHQQTWSFKIEDLRRKDGSLPILDAVVTNRGIWPARLLHN